MSDVSATTTPGAAAAAAVDWVQAEGWSIGRIGGRGLYHAVDLVRGDGSPIVREDRAFDFSGDLSQTPTRVVEREAAKHGVWLTGFVPNTIKVAPPLTVTADEVDLLLAAFDAGLDEIERTYW